MDKKITRPNGKALTRRGGIWHIIFYEDGKKVVRSLNTKDKLEAAYKRDRFFIDVPVHQVRKTGKYIYHRPESWVVKVRGVFVGEAKDEAAAETMRDTYMKENP